MSENQRDLEFRIQQLEAALLAARHTFADYHDNWDCDEDAHRHHTVCRCCDAKDAMQHIDSVLTHKTLSPSTQVTDSEEFPYCDECAGHGWLLDVHGNNVVGYCACPAGIAARKG